MGDREFKRVCALLEQHSGIRYTPDKRNLVTTRLLGRLRERDVASFSEYVRLLDDPTEHHEVMRLVDALTTHETYFFREPQHFEFLDRHLAELPTLPRSFDCWSAACSSGEEPYTLAMQLAERLPLGSFRVTGTDVSSAMVERAHRAVYPMARAQHIPPEVLRRWCRRGQGSWEGHLLVARELRAHVSFQVANLCLPQPSLGPFDVVLLRNVLIYFGARDRHAIVRNVADRIKPGGLLIVGHSESATGLHPRLQPLQPSIYRLRPT